MAYNVHKLALDNDTGAIQEEKIFTRGIVRRTSAERVAEVMKRQDTEHDYCVVKEEEEWLEW